MLTNYHNYFMYEQYVRERSQPMTIDVDAITIDTFDDYFNGCINILLDAPNTISEDDILSGRAESVSDEDEEYVSHTPIWIDFRGAIKVPLMPVDLLFNLAGWYAIIRTGDAIQPRHIIFDPRYMTRGTIKKFFDNHVIPQVRKRIPNKDINAILDDTSYLFRQADRFSNWLMDTINLRDFIDLMHIDPEFYETLFVDLTDVPIEDFKKAGMDITTKAINIIMKSGDVMPYEHCLAVAFRSKEGINEKQYKEFGHSIGAKPDGNGGVFPIPINTSFINGGIGDPMYYLIDSSAGRTAQILSKINVGDSGAFARLLGLNNTDTFLHHDPTYDCHTTNYQRFHVGSIEHLQRIMGRYYKLQENGIEYNCTTADTHLIGKTILLRSPQTCASFAKGHGICYKCYGDLAYTNNNINIGKMAAEILSSRLTQRLLSAKHLLETSIAKLVWTPGFDEFFELDVNAIKLQDDLDYKAYSIIIDPDDIDMEDKLDYYSDDEGNSSSSGSEVYNEFITKFVIRHNKSGELFEINTENFDKMYLSSDFNNIIRRKASASDDNKFVIPLSALSPDDYIFYMVIHNNELSKTMEDIMNIINKNPVTKSMDRHQLLQAFVDTTIKGGLYISSVHCEVILANQLRDAENILERPNWEIKDIPYQILTLHDALNYNPSIVITLMYQSLSKVLYNPLSFKKRGVSFIDLFFQEHVTDTISNAADIIDGEPDDLHKSLVSPFIKVETPE